MGHGHAPLGPTTELGGWVVSQTLANLHAGRVGFISYRRKEEILLPLQKEAQNYLRPLGHSSFQPLQPWEY